MQFAKRLEQIPPYLFAEIDRKRVELIDQGIDIINLGVGDPDQPTLAPITKAMHEAIEDAETHTYPPYCGTLAFREAVRDWMEQRFGVADLDPQREILASIGSKEAIHNTFLAFVNPGDGVIIPDPGYPVYRSSTIFAGGQPYPMPLLPERQFLPNLQAIPEAVARSATLLWVNYPNNPTGAIAPFSFLEELVEYCQHYDILLCHDHAYSEITYDGYCAPSVLQVPGAKAIAIEFHSLSKSYNMAGWRIGFVVGNSMGIRGISQVKSNIDSGVFKAIQRAAIAALRIPASERQGLLERYQERRDAVINGLQSLGWSITPPLGTLYIWVPVPPGYTSMGFTEKLMEACGVIVPPGSGYGERGEGFVRISLTVPRPRIEAAFQRLRDADIRYA